MLIDLCIWIHTHIWAFSTTQGGDDSTHRVEPGLLYKPKNGSGATVLRNHGSDKCLNRHSVTVDQMPGQTPAETKHHLTKHIVTPKKINKNINDLMFYLPLVWSIKHRKIYFESHFHCMAKNTYPKIFILCCTEGRRSYRFGTTRWVNDCKMFIFGYYCTIPLVMFLCLKFILILTECNKDV